MGKVRFRHQGDLGLAQASGRTITDPGTHEGATDWDCLFKAQSRDHAAWSTLVTRYYPRMVALGLLMTGSRAAAEDIAQETFSRALTAKIRETSGSVHGYLGTIAYRLALKEIDRASRHVSEPNSELVAPQAGPLEEILVNERDRAVTRAIRALPANHRDVLILRFYAGRTYEEIAAQLDVPLGTVKSRIFYAVKACRNSLHESGVL